MRISTPWALAGISPVLPVRASAAIDAAGAPRLTPTAASAVRLATPWTALDVRLPAAATALPEMTTTPATVPAPRGTGTSLAAGTLT